MPFKPSPSIHTSDSLRDFGPADVPDTPYKLARRDALMRSLPGRLQAGQQDAGFHRLPDRQWSWLGVVAVLWVVGALTVGAFALGMSAL